MSNAEKECDMLASSNASGSHDETYDPEACQKKERKGSWYSIWWSTTNSSQVDPVARSPYRTITRSLDDAPEGYSKVATFQSSDRNFLQYRGFGYLHCRVLSALQYDIEKLEYELDRLDQFDKSDAGDDRKLSCRERDDLEDTLERTSNEKLHAQFKRTRPEVLTELRLKLMEYDEVLLRTKDIANLQRPSKRDYESVRDWFVDEKPLVDPEALYVQRKEDIVTLRSGRECASFDSLVERVLSRFDRFLVKRCKCNIVKRMFMTPELHEKSKDKRMHYYAPARVASLINAIITLVIFVLMVLPVVALYEMSDISTATPFEAIGVLIVFTLLFGGAMSSLTKATRHELFAACAAYCAVLVVFINNFTTQDVIIAGDIRHA